MEAGNTDGKREPKRPPMRTCIPPFIVVPFISTGLYGTLVSGGLLLVLGVEARHPGVVGHIFVEGSMFLAILTVVITLPRLERHPFSDLGLSLEGHASRLWYGLPMVILFYLLGLEISVISGEIEITDFQFRPLNLLGSWVSFLLVVLFEEILMYGYILGRLPHTNMNKFLALFISSVLLAFMHIFNPEIAFLPMLNLLPVSMLLGASYLYTQNLCFSIFLHLFWNWIQGPILGHQVSGNNFTTSTLTLCMPEESILNGGVFGSKGSFICIVLMIVSTILIVRWGEKRETISFAVPRSYQVESVSGYNPYLPL